MNSKFSANGVEPLLFFLVANLLVLLELELPDYALLDASYYGYIKAAVLRATFIGLGYLELSSF